MLVSMVCAVLLLLVWSGTARSGDAIQLSVRVIYAANTGKGVDGQLSDLSRQLRMFRYTTYELMGQHRLFRSIGQRGSVSLPGGKTLQLTPQGITGGSVVLLASIRHGGNTLLNTELKLANRGTILVGGPLHAGGVLILAISAAIP